VVSWSLGGRPLSCSVHRLAQPSGPSCLTCCCPAQRVFCASRFMDDMHGIGLWNSAEGTETQREYDRGDLVRESPVARNTHSDE
jgi:hypothetical protein